METRRRAQIQQSLRSLADSYKITMELMEHTFELLCEELELDPLTYLRTRPAPPPPTTHVGKHGFTIDPAFLSVAFRGKVCFLGDTLCFKLISFLARRPNAYFPYETLLADVWDGVVRSDSAVRSVVKILRTRLREAGLPDLADAIDGTVRRHYALKLAQ